jgi:XTP/dITP diphosphohydrolase
MKEIVFATNNANKIREVQEMLGEAYVFKNLAEIGCTEELPETTHTIEGNARQKARYVWSHYGKNCFSEDTGLEVDALGGEPGVHTAYYAGPQRDPKANMAKVLEGLGDEAQRSARFRTVIALIIDGKEWVFEGVVEGNISHKPQGEGGFGYDPIFCPEGQSLTFAEIPAAEKHQISHRARAMQKLQAFLLDLSGAG